MSLLTPIIYSRAGDASNKVAVEYIFSFTKKISFFIIFATILLSLIFCFVHKYIFILFTSSDYHYVSKYLPIMVLAAAFHASHHVIGMRISSMLAVNRIFLPQLLSAFLFVILNFIGAFYDGLRGQIISFLISSFFYFIWIYIYTEVIKSKSIKIVKSLNLFYFLFR